LRRGEISGLEILAELLEGLLDLLEAALSGVVVIEAAGGNA